MALQSASCIRNIGLLAIGTTLLTLLFLILSGGNTGRGYQPGAVDIPSHHEYHPNVPVQVVSPVPHHPHVDLEAQRKKEEERRKKEEEERKKKEEEEEKKKKEEEEKKKKEEEEKKKKERGNVLVILPKDERTGGDFGFMQGGWLERAIQNRKDYADLHGYHFIWENLSKYEPEYSIDACWAKVAALAHSFEEYPDVEWMWMLDSDAIILNSSIDLWDLLLSPEAIVREAKPEFGVHIPGGAKIEAQKKTVFTPKVTVPEEVYIIIAADGNGINAGSFFIRRNKFTEAMIDFWRDPYLMNAQFGYREQDALAHLMVTHESVIKHTAVVDQKLINQYIDRLVPGDFVVHFAGCRFYKDRDCDKLFLEQWEKADKPSEQKAAKAKAEEEKTQP